MIIHRVLERWRESRAWTAEHRETWPPYTALIDGKSRLLIETELAIQNAAHAGGLVVSDRVEDWMQSTYGGEEIYVSFKLLPLVDVWLHADRALIDSPLRGRVFEEWDFRTPADFIAAVRAEVVDWSRKHRQAPPSNSAAAADGNPPHGVLVCYSSRAVCRS